MPLPCVIENRDGLVLFQATADQRFALGKETFLATHLPVRFWYSRAGISKVWTEEDLLQALRAPAQTLRGNRVFMLFGAAGSGKSEVMRWLLCHLAEVDPIRNRFTMRIARTELDPVRIVNRLLTSFDARGLKEEVLQRWSLLRQKPVAVANQIVWQALIGTYDRDEEILPLSYRLRPVIEANLRAGFAAMEEPEATQRPLQLLSVEQLQQVLAETVLPFQPTYEQMRARLQNAFDDLILGGVRLVPALREISRRIRVEYGIRPILIIDDLVQSMNVYASDLLDYLITLEEGEWDVVLGLTPASFEWDRRGRELLLRVRELDTIDDRVIKLDLSDTTGDQSAFLDQGSAADLVLPYLDQYKAAAGYKCNSECPHWKRCGALQWDQDETRLGPFNRAFMTRLWRNLPTGKGRVRYLLLTVRAALEEIANQGASALEGLSALIERDRFIDHPDPRVRALLECYGPTTGQEKLTIPEDIAEIWQVPLQQRVAIHTLVPDPSLGRSSYAAKEVEPEPEPVLAAVRDWLEGGIPNPELMRPLRVGVTRFLRDLVDPTLLAGIGHPQCAGSLRWVSVQSGVGLPLRIEGVDDGIGIPVSRSLGGSAFDLLAYASSRGVGKTNLLNRLLNHADTVSMLYYAEEQRQTWRSELANGLRGDVPELAFHMYRIMVALGGAKGFTPLSFLPEATPGLPELAWPEDMVHATYILFQDCFLLRDHLWDGHSLALLLERYEEPADSIAQLDRFSTGVSDSYRICDQPVGSFLTRYRNHLAYLMHWLAHEAATGSERMNVVETCMALLDGRRRRALAKRIGSLQALATQTLLVPLLPPLPSPSVMEEVSNQLGALASREHALAAEPTNPIRKFRVIAQWTVLKANAWVAAVAQWRREIERLYVHLEGMGGDSRVEGGSAPTPVLLDQISRLLSPGRDEGKSGPPLGKTVDRLLAYLLPEGFGVAERFAKARAESMMEESVLHKCRGVWAACAWWEGYLQQLSLLRRRGRRSQLDRIVSFLEAAGRLEQPPADSVKAWGLFVRRMRQAGTLDLPIRQWECSTSLPPRLQAWLPQAVGGTTLAELEPDVLSELNTYAPKWAQLMRITMVPEATMYGILHLMDG